MRDGVVAEVRDLPSNELIEDVNGAYPTLDELLLSLESAAHRSFNLVTAEFDPHFGFPTVILGVGLIPFVTDQGFATRVTAFTPE